MHIRVSRTEQRQIPGHPLTVRTHLSVHHPLELLVVDTQLLVRTTFNVDMPSEIHNCAAFAARE